MRHVTVLCLVMAGLLAGCASGPPPGAASTASSGHVRVDSRLTQVRLAAPANQLAGQLLSSRRARPVLIRQALLDEHQRWVGTPYVLGGEGRRGIDCSALVQQVFSDAFALELPRTTRGQVLEGRLIERAELKAGDLVFFRPPGAYRHVGIYAGDGYFLHASTSQGVILSRLDNVFWQRYYWQARRPFEHTLLAQRADRLHEG